MVLAGGLSDRNQLIAFAARDYDAGRSDLSGWLEWAAIHNSWHATEQNSSGVALISSVNTASSLATFPPHWIQDSIQNASAATLAAVGNEYCQLKDSGKWVLRGS